MNYSLYAKAVAQATHIQTLRGSVWDSFRNILDSKGQKWMFGLLNYYWSRDSSHVSINHLNPKGFGHQFEKLALGSLLLLRWLDFLNLMLIISIAKILNRSGDVTLMSSIHVGLSLCTLLIMRWHAFHLTNAREHKFWGSIHSREVENKSKSILTIVGDRYLRPLVNMFSFCHWYMIQFYGTNSPTQTRVVPSSEGLWIWQLETVTLNGCCP